uniref:Uncharacterized protein n=1 Tax=Anguilla anguilla TaxID=7936 RepID=A0A0E9WFD9_ANGAN
MLKVNYFSVILMITLGIPWSQAMNAMPALSFYFCGEKTITRQDDSGSG